MGGYTSYTTFLGKQREIYFLQQSCTKEWILYSFDYDNVDDDDDK
jgi:hypothetical protein